MISADLPNIEAGSADVPTQKKLLPKVHASHRPRILLLAGWSSSSACVSEPAKAWVRGEVSCGQFEP
jgi:hypothetical protein